MRSEPTDVGCYERLTLIEHLNPRVADFDAATNNSMLAAAEAYFNAQQARGELAGAELTAKHAEELVHRTDKLVQGIADRGFCFRIHG